MKAPCMNTLIARARPGAAGPAPDDHRSWRLGAGATILLLAGLLLATASAWADPPARVARLSYLAGEVSFSPAGEEAWHAAQLNRPVVVGDRLWTERGARLELEMGTAVLRLDQGSAIGFLNLDDALAQVQFTQGVLNLRVDIIHEGQVYEIDTPTLAMVISEPGEFRVDIAPTGDSTQVTVFSGRADIYGENGQLVRVASGNSIRFHDPSLANPRRMDIPHADDFDRWAFARNDRYLNSPTRRYVSAEMIGYADLDEHGSWRPVAEYGHVWFPRHVSAGWAPYRYGRWSWIEPWGWTWVDDHPWGFAPSHYGRWVYVSSGWGWVPGPRHLRPVFAPALVAFVGGSGWRLTVSTGGPPIGWFPLGPHDIYMPWYRVSRSYFSRVNVHNTVVVNNIYVTNIYNDYYVQGRVPRRNYTFRNAANAVTVVPRDSFIGGRRAADAQAQLRPGALRQGELLTRAPATPVRASLAGPAASRTAVPDSRQRNVIARHQPAPAIAGFERRQAAIARNGGEPLASDQLRRLSADTGSSRSRNVRLIDSARSQPATSIAARPGRDTAVRGQLGEVAIQPAPVQVPDSRADSQRQAAARAPAARSAGDATAPASAPAPATRRSIGPRDSVSARPGIALPESAGERGRALPSSRYVPRDNRPDGSRESATTRQAPAAATRQTPSQSRPIQPGVRSVTPQTAPAQRNQQPATRQPPATGSRAASGIRLPASQPRATAPATSPPATPPARSTAPAIQTPTPRQNTPAVRSQPQPDIRSAAPASSRQPAAVRSAQPATSAPRATMPAARSSTPASGASRSRAPSVPARSAATPRSAPAPAVREPAARPSRPERGGSSRSQERR